jgi:acetyl-CoA carboxylase carboxyltransferase component
VQNIIEKLEQRREQARQGGGAARIATQHAKGKLTARALKFFSMKIALKNTICL